MTEFRVRRSLATGPIETFRKVPTHLTILRRMAVTGAGFVSVSKKALIRAVCVLTPRLSGIFTAAS